MRLNIFAKLFLAILATAFIVILCVMLFMNWSFRTGFDNYQYENDVVKTERLAIILAEGYQAQGSWDFILIDRANWAQALADIGEGDPRRPQRRGAPPPPPPGEEGRPARWDRESRPERAQPRLPPPPDTFSLPGRLTLRNLQEQVIIGRPRPATAVERIPVKWDEQTLGWLELAKGERVPDQVTEGFLQQQVRNAYLVALFGVLLSLLIAFLIARQFLRPLRRLTQGAKTLAQGHYSTRLPVNANDELGDLAMHFNQLAASLKRNETLRAQWITDISHELRTPLAVLRSEVEALQDGVRKPTPERINSLHAEILSLGKLVDDLHQLSLADADEWDNSSLEVLEINTVLADALTGAAVRLDEKGLALTVDLQAGFWQVCGDAERLRQVFSNLLENSYRYTDAPGQIKVSSHIEQGWVIIQVDDSKPGVPDESLPRLFDRLYRVDRSRSRALGGSGLGLSICKGIVEAQGGRIHAQHSPLGGLTVCVAFPLLSADNK